MMVLWPEPEAPLKITEPSIDLSGLEKIINYQFSNKWWLVESLTHTSYSKPQTHCYQRLEFLGK